MIFAHLQGLTAVHLFFFWPAEVVRSHFGKWLLWNYYMAVLLAVQPAYDQVNQETTLFHWWGSTLISLPKIKTAAGNRLSKDECMNCKTNPTLTCNTESLVYQKVYQVFSFFSFFCLSGHNNLGGRNTQQTNSPMEINSLPCIFNWKHSLQTASLKKRSMKCHFKAAQTLVSSAAAPAQKNSRWSGSPTLLVDYTNQSKQK